jgi:aspartyl-tRNA(Asn)/glutamyl-tRNA(Gln) amidotransferase subunit C
MKQKIDIDHICALANLKISEGEKARLEPQLVRIVEWVNKLEELKLDVTQGEVYTPISLSLPLREDEVQPSISSEDALSNSPDTGGKFIKVPKVIEEK